MNGRRAIWIALTASVASTVKAWNSSTDGLLASNMNATGSMTVDMPLNSSENQRFEIYTGVDTENLGYPSQIEYGTYLSRFVYAESEVACNANISADYALCGYTFAPQYSSKLSDIYQKLLGNTEGACGAAVPQQCSIDFQKTVSDYIRSNGTGKAHNETCKALSDRMPDLIPKSCTDDSTAKEVLDYFNYLELAGPDGKACRNERENPITSFDTYTIAEVWAFRNDSSPTFREKYSQMINRTLPLLLVSFPVDPATHHVPEQLDYVGTNMQCLRPSTVNPGSTQPTAAYGSGAVASNALIGHAALVSAAISFVLCFGM